jgi:hypothetical protein
MRSSRPILWGVAAVLLSPWLVPINQVIVDLLSRLPVGISGRDIATVAAVVLVVVLVMKER